MANLQIIQFSSVTQSCPTLCNPGDCSMPGFPVHHQLPQIAQTHVHWVSDTNHWTKLVRCLNLLSWISYFNRLDGGVTPVNFWWLEKQWETQAWSEVKWSEVKPLSHCRQMLYRLGHQGSNTGMISDNPLSSLCFSPFPETVGKFLPASLCVKLLI